MKKLKVMALILASTTVLSTGVLPAAAADASPSAAYVQQIQGEIANDPEIQSEVAAAASEAETVPSEFNWNGLREGETKALTEEAFKIDLSGRSMANDSLAGGSTVTKVEGGYEFTINVKTTSKTLESGTTLYSAKPEMAYITYYDVEDGSANTKTYEVKPDPTNDAQTTYRITFTIAEKNGENGPEGMLPYGAAKNYQNMIKVNLKTDITGIIPGFLIPEAMKNPTFFYAFNVNS